MMGGTVWSSDALWNGVTLLNDAAVGVYGMILSAAFCNIRWDRKNVLWLSLIHI